jgi:hypothetical protein
MAKGEKLVGYFRPVKRWIKQLFRKIGAAMRASKSYVIAFIGIGCVFFPSSAYYTKLVIDPSAGSLTPLLAILAVFLSLTSVCFSWCNSYPATEVYKHKKDKVRGLAVYLLQTTIIYFVCLILTFLIRNMDYVIPKTSGWNSGVIVMLECFSLPMFYLAVFLVLIGMWFLFLELHEDVKDEE